MEEVPMLPRQERNWPRQQSVLEDTRLLHRADVGNDDSYYYNNSNQRMISSGNMTNDSWMNNHQGINSHHPRGLTSQFLLPPLPEVPISAYHQPNRNPKIIGWNLPSSPRTTIKDCNNGNIGYGETNSLFFSKQVEPKNLVGHFSEVSGSKNFGYIPTCSLYSIGRVNDNHRGRRDATCSSKNIVLQRRLQQQQQQQRHNKKYDQQYEFNRIKNNNDSSLEQIRTNTAHCPNQDSHNRGNNRGIFAQEYLHSNNTSEDKITSTTSFVQLCIENRWDDILQLCSSTDRVENNSRKDLNLDIKVSHVEDLRPQRRYRYSRNNDDLYTDTPSSSYIKDVQGEDIEKALLLACEALVDEVHDNDKIFKVLKALIDHMKGPMSFQDGTSSILHVCIKSKASFEVLKYIITVVSQHYCPVQLSESPCSTASKSYTAAVTDTGSTVTLEHHDTVAFMMGRKRKLESIDTTNTDDEEAVKSSTSSLNRHHNNKRKKSALLVRDNFGRTALQLLVESISIVRNKDALKALDLMICEYSSLIQNEFDEYNPLSQLVGAGIVTSNSTKRETNKTCSDNDDNNLIYKAIDMLIFEFPFLIHHVPPMKGISSPIHLALSKGSSECSLQLIQHLLPHEGSLSSSSSHHKVAAAIQKVMSMKDNNSNLPLHVALASGVSNDVLEYILQQATSKELLLQLDGRLLSPIHIAWIRHVDASFGPYTVRLRNGRVLGEMLEGSVQQIIDKLSLLQETNAAVVTPRSLDTNDNNQKRKEVSSNDRNSNRNNAQDIVDDDYDHKLQVVEDVLGDFWKKAMLIMQYGPNGEQHQRHSGNNGKYKEWNILHAALGLNCPKSIITLLLELFESDVKVKNVQTGQYPLHIACISPHFSHDQKIYVIERLLSMYPQAASQKDSYGYLPLHYAIESFKRYGGGEGGKDKENNNNIGGSTCWSSVIVQLSNYYMEGLEERYPNTKLYPFMQAAAPASSEVSIVGHRRHRQCNNLNKTLTTNTKKSATVMISTVYQLLLKAPHLVHLT